MARSIWTGAISFGLVNIPVKLFSAVEAKEVHFQMLHEKDGGKIHLKRVCSKDGKEVPWEEVGKGYAVSKRKMVMVAPEELEALDPKATRTVDISDFVELSEIDPIYYDATYFLAPASESAAKAYALLFEAMKKQGKVGIARFVMRTKQYLCAIRPMGESLVLSTMQYADEIRGIDVIEGLPVTTRPGRKELEMAERLVEQLAGHFEPDKYEDDYRERVLELIEKKAEGAEIEIPEEAPPQAAVVDLAEALRASLGNARPRSRAAGERRAAARRTSGKRPAKSAKTKATKAKRR
jgi:DNA end-binding protein Ku